MSHITVKLNFLQYLHEKAQESRNKETQGCLMFLAGAVFFVGGIIESLNLTDPPNWFIFIPYHTTPIPGAILGLTLVISGFSLIIFGIATAIKWRLNRRWYLEELRKASSEKWSKLKQSKSVRISTLPVRRRKRRKKKSIEWWVYDNWSAKTTRARVHKATCLYCNYGLGVKESKTEEVNAKWWGSFDTWKSAWKTAERLERKDTDFCKNCCKQLSEVREKGKLEFLFSDSQTQTQMKANLRQTK